MSNKSKNKGKSFEREVCQLFNKITGLSWVRVPNSGAFIGGNNAFRIQQLSDQQVLLTRGDIIPPEEFQHMMIECKARKEFQFHQLFEQNKEFESWIDQVEVDLQASNAKCPLIIFKPNRRGLYIAGLYDQLNKNVTHGNRLHYEYNDKIWVIFKLTEEWLIANIKLLEELSS